MSAKRYLVRRGFLCLQFFSFDKKGRRKQKKRRRRRRIICRWRRMLTQRLIN
jgi:hypothetical protein